MIRSFLFSIFFFLGIILISIIFIPSFFLPQKVVLFGGKIMGHWSAICLRIFLSTKIIIKGKENIITDEKFFIACSHQSMFETFYLQTIFNSPIFILKKELVKIPIFGWYLKKIGSITIATMPPDFPSTLLQQGDVGLRRQALIDRRELAFLHHRLEGRSLDKFHRLCRSTQNRKGQSKNDKRQSHDIQSPKSASGSTRTA